jgi:hypothetical protein
MGNKHFWICALHYCVAIVFFISMVVTSSKGYLKYHVMFLLAYGIYLIYDLLKKES